MLCSWPTKRQYRKSGEILKAAPEQLFYWCCKTACIKKLLKLYTVASVDAKTAIADYCN